MAVRDADFNALVARVVELEDLVIGLQARQLNQKTHDPTCNFTEWQMGLPRTDPTLPKRACNCWLTV